MTWQQLVWLEVHSKPSFGFRWIFTDIVFSQRGSCSTLFFKFLVFIRSNSFAVSDMWSEKNLRLPNDEAGFALPLELIHIFHVDFSCTFTLEKDRVFWGSIMYLVLPWICEPRQRLISFRLSTSSPALRDDNCSEFPDPAHLRVEPEVLLVLPPEPPEGLPPPLLLSPGLVLSTPPLPLLGLLCPPPSPWLPGGPSLLSRLCQE